MSQRSNGNLLSKGRAPIRPELLAAKLASIRNHEQPELLAAIADRPRLVETLWFIQYMSLQAGGLEQFCEEMIQQLPTRFGSETMRTAGPGQLSLEVKLQICSEIPKRFWPLEPELDFKSQNLIDLMAGISSFESLAEDEPAPRATAEDRTLVAKQLRNWDLNKFREGCLKAAREMLPEFLSDLCTEKDKNFEPDTFREHKPLWFIDDLIGAVMQMMDLQATRARDRIAMTEVAKLVFDRLDYALAEKVMVRIEGGSRFGKTEALSSWVQMRPGLARLVRVPCDNSMVSFFKRIGEALGIDCSYGSNPSRLKERIEFIIQHSGLFLVMDEAHFLTPMNFTATTQPHRLNWVRTEIVDRGLPLAISMTPQSFMGAVNRFVKKTGYDMTQFFGRDFLPCLLPDVLSEEDLIAVARKHFPGLGENALGYIANEARLSQNYLQAVEAIARRTRYLAGKRGGAVKLKDLQTAVSEVLPRRSVTADRDAEADQVEPVAVSRPLNNRPIQEPLKPVARGLQPAGNNRRDVENFSSCSLRGAGPVEVETGLVPVET